VAGDCAGLEEADRAEDDFEELKRAALDGLSTKRRLRTAVLPVDDGAHEAIDVKKLGRSQRAQLVSKVPRASSRSERVGKRWWRTQAPPVARLCRQARRAPARAGARDGRPGE